MVTITIEFVCDIIISVFHDVVVSVSLNLPAHRLNLQTAEVQFQLVANRLISTTIGVISLIGTQQTA